MEENATQPVTSLTRIQRRVLGVLVEKGLTTPEYYPLTLKAVTSGCNQKSNRAPVTSDSEENVLDALEELRQLGLVAEVHTESGRTPRFRHYMRRRFDWTEPQLAIMTELLLRGCQQPGELRNRVGRMVAIESLKQLRSELRAMQRQDLIAASGPLERRGVEVDHNWYTDSETRRIQTADKDSGTPVQAPSHRALSSSEIPAPLEPVAALPAGIEHEISRLREEIRVLQDETESQRDDLRRLSEQFEELRVSLGG